MDFQGCNYFEKRSYNLDETLDSSKKHMCSFSVVLLEF